MINKKRAVILVDSSNACLDQLRSSIIDCCNNNDFYIIKIIEVQNEYDCEALTALCQAVSKANSYGYHISLIIDENSFAKLSCFLIWIVALALQKEKLIDNLYLYQENTFCKPTIKKIKNKV